MRIIAGTGHRPEDGEAEEVVRTKAGAALRYSGADVFITGCAAGFDLWAADEAIDLGIEIWAARPWAGHSPRKGDESLYARVLEAASRIVVVTESDRYPGAWVYPKRNHWMVDNATHVLAYWSGKESGGTYECRQYAKQKGKPVRNIWNAAPF